MLRLELATACLQDPNERTRKVGVTLLAEEGPEADYLLVQSMGDPSSDVWQTARSVLLHRYPWLVLEPSSGRPVPASALEGPYGTAWSSLRQAIGRAVRECERGPQIATRLRTVPGAVPDLTEELQQLPQGAPAREWADEFHPDDSATPRSRQIMLAPTYRCNLACSYCYAKNFGNGFPPDMSLQDMASAFAWAAAQDVSHIVLCGGEPTVYAHLGRLFEMARAHGMIVHLTTNCLYALAIRQLIIDPPVGELVAHYDQERMQSDETVAGTFTANLRAARDGGMDVMIRYTLTGKSGPAEWQPMMDLARRLAVGRINYALAFCGSEGLNAYFRCRDAVGAPGGQLENMLTAFSADAARWGLRLYLCKPFPLCALNIGTFRSMLGGEAIRSACAVFRDDFTRNLTINPDLSTFPCNGIAIRGPKITEFSNLADAGRHHAQAIRGLILRPFDEDCRRCVLWYRGFCQGACLAEHYGMAREEKKRREGPS